MPSRSVLKYAPIGDTVCSPFGFSMEYVVGHILFLIIILGYIDLKSRIATSVYIPGLNTLNQQGVLSIGWCRNTGPGEWILFGFAVEPSGQSLVSGMPSFMPNDFYNSKYVAYNTAQGWPNIYN